MGVLNESISGFKEVFSLYSPITSNSPLTQWTEVPGQIGFIHCIHQNTNNILVFAIKTDKVLVHELKSTTKNVKVQNAVCYYSPATKQRQLQDQTTLIMLLDDGSLRISNANQDLVNFIDATPPKLRFEICIFKPLFNSVISNFIDLTFDKHLQLKRWLYSDHLKNVLSANLVF